MSHLRIPPALKGVFDAFPLKTLPRDPLPSGYPTPDPKTPSLYIFSTPSAAAAHNPSFNPSCLKWQTYLHFRGIKHRLVPSTNHASPTGALPFIMADKVVPSSRIAQWAGEPSDTTDALVFSSLLDTKLREAWLYALFLEPGNFHALASVQYCATRVPLVRFMLAQQMHAEAERELLCVRPGGVVVADDVYADAEEAVAALSVRLGSDVWFFGSPEPGLFDAAVFGYLHLILTLQWDEREAGLRRVVRRYANLVAHEERIRKRVYPNAPASVGDAGKMGISSGALL